MGNKSGEKSFVPNTPNRRHIIKAAARGHKKGVADKCYKDQSVQHYLLKNIARKIQQEVKDLCSLYV